MTIPMLIRNTIANAPNMLSALKLLPVISPNANAIRATIADRKITRMLGAKTLERIMGDLATWVLRTLFNKLYKEVIEKIPPDRIVQKCKFKSTPN